MARLSMTIIADVILLQILVKIVAEFVTENKNTLKIVSTFVSMKRKTPESQCFQGFLSSGGRTFISC